MSFSQQLDPIAGEILKHPVQAYEKCQKQLETITEEEVRRDIMLTQEIIHCCSQMTIFSGHIFDTADKGENDNPVANAPLLCSGWAAVLDNLLKIKTDTLNPILANGLVISSDIKSRKKKQQVNDCWCVHYWGRCL